MFYRYKVIQNGDPSQQPPSFRKKALSIGISWSYALLWCVFPLFGWSAYGPEGIKVSCALTWQSRDASSISYLLLLFALSFMVPVVIIFGVYIKIYLKIRHHYRSVAPQSQNIISMQRNSVDTPQRQNSQTPMDTERKIAKTGLIMTCSFCLAWLPYSVASLMALRDPSSITPLQATLPAIFAKSSACYFPVIYGITHSSFKREFLRMIRRTSTDND